MLVASPMPPLVDLHCHILPGVDDGARDVAESLHMLRLAAADGITTVVATPHAHHARTCDIPALVADLQARAHDEGLNVCIVPGSETRITSGMDADLRAGRLTALGGTRWLLLELPLHDEWPRDLVFGVINKLQALGARPLLAHAERYPFVQHNPTELAAFIASGVPVQVNARALFFREHDVERRTAETLVRARLAHVVASDAHNARYRPPVISTAVRRVAEVADAAYAQWMIASAAAVLEDADIALPEPRWPSK